MPAPPSGPGLHLSGTLKADRVTGAMSGLRGGYDRNGVLHGRPLQGSFTFTLKLLDHHHGDAILSEGSVLERQHLEGSDLA